MKARFNHAFALVTLSALAITACSRDPRRREAKFLDQGRKHMQARIYDRAAIDFKNAAQAMPQDPEPHYQLGLMYLGTGEAQPAVSQFVRALQLDPQHVGAKLRLTELMAQNNNADVVRKSRDQAQEILAVSPGNADALNALAYAELRLDDTTDAVTHLDQALAKVPENLTAAIALAMVKLRAKDQAGAEQILLKSVADAPKSAPHAVVLGRFYLAVQDPGKAEAQFRRALDLDPRSGPALVSLANLLNRAGRIDEADQMFKRASALPDMEYRSLHAMFLLQHNQNDKAIAELEQLYKADRADRAIRTRLVAAYNRLGRSADAEKILDDALRRNSKDADALMERGEYFLSVGRYDDARKDVTNALPFRGESAPAHFLLARIHHARGASKEEMQELSEALRLDPELLAARLELTDTLTATNSAKEALAVLDQVPDQNKADLPVIIERNAVLYALGDFAQMRIGVEIGLAIARDPALLLQDGLLRLKLNDTKGGRASLEEALQVRPEQWSALQALALSYVSEKKTAEATAIVRKYTALTPKSAMASRFLGAWLAVTGDHAGARSAYQAEKALEPGSLAPDFSIAELDLADGQLDSARGILTGILAQNPQNTKANLDMGYLEEKTGHVDKAIAFYEKTVQQAPQNIAALNNLAYLLADTGKDPDRAVMLSQRVKELSPTDPNIDDTIGWAYYNKGLFRSAVDYLSKAENNGSARAKLHLAMTYAKLGDSRRARTIMAAALKQDPNLPEARQALSTVGQAQ